MNRKVSYKIINPGGNITALVNGIDYSKEEKKIINDEILKNNRTVEQVGFIDKSQKTLVMAGGEFCLNATRCAIWSFLNGNSGQIELEASGIEDKIVGGISNGEVFVNYNINKNMVNLVRQLDNYFMVNLKGITLAVLNEEESKEYINELVEKEEATKLRLKEKMKDIDTNEKAVGIILLEKVNEITKINPIIWVKEIDTIYYETACGSGSLAAAIYEFKIDGKRKNKILQPSGYCIDVELVDQNNNIELAIVTGKIISQEDKILNKL